MMLDQLIISALWSLHILHRRVWVLSSYAGFLPQYKDVRVFKLTGDSKLARSVDSCPSATLQHIGNLSLQS